MNTKLLDELFHCDQKVLSELIGISKGTLYKYMRGERKIPFSLLCDIADYLSKNVEDLVGFDCPTCGEYINRAVDMNRYGYKLSNKEDSTVYDCPNCGVIHLSSDFVLDDEIYIHFVENQSDKSLLNHIIKLRKENDLKWHEPITLNSRHSIFDQICNYISFSYKDITVEYPFYPWTDDLGYLKDELTINGETNNYSWKLRYAVDGDFILIFPGSVMVLKSYDDDETVEMFRDLLISEKFVEKTSNGFKFVRRTVIRHPELAERLVTGNPEVQHLKVDDIWDLDECKDPEPVVNYEQVLVNATKYIEYINKPSNKFRKNMYRTKMWYYIEELDTFVANKFIAYQNNNELKYNKFTNKTKNPDGSTNDKMDGGHARRILEKLFVKTNDDELIRKFSEFKNKYNIKESKSITNAELFVRK